MAESNDLEIDDIPTVNIKEFSGPTSPPHVVYEPPIKRKRGRPKGSKNRPKDEEPRRTVGEFVNKVSDAVSDSYSLDKAEKKVADRADGILMGGTAVLSILSDRDYVQMTKEEAERITEPLASWVRSRSAGSVEWMEERLDDFDLVAVFFGLAAYAIRVLKEAKKERDANRAERQSARNNTSANRPTVVRSQEKQEQESQSLNSDNTDASVNYGYSAPPAPGF